MQIYDKSFDFNNIDLHKKFEKWAAAEVSAVENIGEDMETIDIPDGLYAVFIQKGKASDGHITFRYIFEKWLPKSPYEIDDRPHFELLGKKYKNEDPTSEEEIYIPIKLKRKN
jgi:AraC family transcriptional regulator